MYVVLNNQCPNQNISPKLTPDEKITIEDICTKLINYLEENQFELADQYIHKMKELEAIWNPIMIRIYADQNQAEPTVD